jgi:hypothetical protein
MLRALGDRTPFRMAVKPVEGEQTEDDLAEALSASRET